MAKLVEMLEKEIGFDPVTKVSVEMQGRLLRRNGELIFAAGQKEQAFKVEKVEGEASPPEQRRLRAVAILAEPRSPSRIILQRWSTEKQGELKSGEKP